MEGVGREVWVEINNKNNRRLYDITYTRVYVSVKFIGVLYFRGGRKERWERDRDREREREKETLLSDKPICT
jgi:hypothetical protein